MPQSRKGDWIQTYTGSAFWPIDPLPEEVHLEDIAHALSLQCRFGGHCEVFYSVAEHSVLSSVVAQDRFPGIENQPLWQWALLHDATEAYVVDVPRPLKRFLLGYPEIESKVSKAIAKKFNLLETMPIEIKSIDNDMLLTEQKTILKPPFMPWGVEGVELGIQLNCWEPSVAKQKFLEQAILLGVVNE